MAITNVVNTEFSKLKEEDDILKKIEDNIARAYSYWKDNIESAKDDIEFMFTSQYNAHEISELRIRSKSPLTFNILHAHAAQLISERAKQDPQIQVRAIDANVSQEAINIREGLLRHIAYDSSSSIAYNKAFSGAIYNGWGVAKVELEYENSSSFNQIAKVCAVEDPLTCYFDPSAKELTKCDAEYCGIYKKMTIDKFKATYKDIENPESILPPEVDNSEFKWRDSDSVTICEHYQKVWKKTKVYLLSNGETVFKEDLDKKLEELHRQNKLKIMMMDVFAAQHEGMPADNKTIKKLVPDITIVDERDTQKAEIRHYRLIKGHILEETVFPGDYLPMVFFAGNTEIIDGKQKTFSFFNFAKDSQKFLNICMTEIAHYLKAGRQGNFLATEAMIGDYKDLWKNPEKPSMALLFKHDRGDKPQYVPATEIPQTLLAMPSQLMALTQTVLGRFDANQGNESNEQSGVAIANRAKQGNLASYIPIYNANKAIEQVNKIILGLLPTIYDSARTVALRDRDGTTTLKQINNSPQTSINNGKFDVVVTAGASFEMQKSDANAQLMQICQIYPPIIPFIIDKIMENTNLDNTPQLVSRVKQLLPPQILAQEKGLPPPQPPQPDKMQLQQMQIANMEAQARLMEAQAKIAKVNQDSQTSKIKANAEIGKAQLEYQGKVEDTKHKIIQNHTALRHKAADFAHKEAMRALDAVKAVTLPMRDLGASETVPLSIINNKAETY